MTLEKKEEVDQMEEDEQDGNFSINGAKFLV